MGLDFGLGLSGMFPEFHFGTSRVKVTCHKKKINIGVGLWKAVENSTDCDEDHGLVVFKVDRGTVSSSSTTQPARIAAFKNPGLDSRPRANLMGLVRSVTVFLWSLQELLIKS